MSVLLVESSAVWGAGTSEPKPRWAPDTSSTGWVLVVLRERGVLYCAGSGSVKSLFQEER